MCRGDVGHGVVGVGDSFMDGYGLPLAGVTCRSWGAWLSWALTTCFTQLAVNGASTERVLRDQIPLVRDDYQLGLIWSGANDIARLKPAAFHDRLAGVSGSLARRCDRVALATLPAALTSSTASQRAHTASRQEANAIVRRVAAETGAILVELEEALNRPWLMSPDYEHPTAIGQLAAAHVAVTALHVSGLGFVRHLPAVEPLAPSPAERRLHWAAPPSRLRRVAARTRQAMQR